MTDTELLIELGTRIKNARIKQNMNPIKLANKCGLGENIIFKIEAGQYNVRLNTLFKISQVMDIRLVDLLDI